MSDDINVNICLTMEQKIKNLYSDIAKEAMLAGMAQVDLRIPKDFFTIVKETFDEPERPEGYNPKNRKYSEEKAVLVTGGLDSSVLYFRLKNKFPNLKAFYIDIGQPYAQKEMDALKLMGIEYERIIDDEIPENGYWKHIIPGRNLYFLCLVAERIKGGTVYFGATDGEMPNKGGDKSKRFLKLVNKLFQKLPYRVKVSAPLQNETKTDLVKWWKKHLPIEKLNYTVSCFKSENGHCGKCQACLRKQLAYLNNGLVLDTNTATIIGCQEYIKKYKEVLPRALKENDFSHYSKKRCLQDLSAILLLEGRKIIVTQDNFEGIFQPIIEKLNGETN